MTLTHEIGKRFGIPRTSIRAKLTVMAAVAVAAFLLISVTESLAVHTIIDRVEREDISRQVYRARRLFDRRAASKAELLSEFAFWDDTWDAVSNPESDSSQAHLRVNFLEWLPQRYGDRLIELWDKNRQLVWQSFDTATVGTEHGIDHPKLFDRLETARLLAGYARGSQGLMLVASALILREWDATLQGPSNGYLVAAEPVDSVRIRALEDELQENLRIFPFTDSWAKDSIQIQLVADGDSIETIFALQGLAGEPVALVALQSSRGFTRQLADSTYLLLAATMVVGIAVLLLLWRVGNRLVVRPLDDIGTSLEQMQQQGSLTRLETVPPTREWDIFVSGFNRTIEALASSERRYQVLFDHAADAHFLLDAKTQTILEANPAAETIAGLPRSDMIGRPFSTVMRLEPSAPKDGTFRHRRNDGSVLTLGVATADVEIGGATRQLASLRDLTRSEALSAQLRQSQKMEAIGSLAGGIAHDFNNLLGAVIMAASTLRQETAGNPGAAESIETIEHASRRAAELTRRLLSFARREPQRTIAVAVNDVARNVVRLCERTFDRAIRIELDAAENLPVVAGDPGQLEQALLNLCINARDAMPAGGTLRLITRQRDVSPAAAEALRDVAPGSYVSVTVEDTGVGLTELAEQHLFEPFFTTKGQGKGTGLGLAIVYGLIRNHGGGIQVRNRPGRGVTFEVYLPISQGVPLPIQPSRLSNAPRGTERLLMIDDEPALRSVVSRAMRKLGYTVDVAETGEEGTRLFDQRPESYDLVLLDMMMPEMGGTETFHRIRRIRPDVPILVCSGYSAEEERNELIESGASGFLPKPFDTNDLASRVRDILDSK
jgi:PAS domain S-box-containing protein